MTSATVSATSVNMRDTPSADATVAAVLAQGNSVDILADNDDGTWLLVSAVVDGTTRIGWIRADLLAVGGSPPVSGDKPAPGDKPATGDTPATGDKPAPGDKPGPAEQPRAGAKPVGDPAPFSTKPSASGNATGKSTTTGLGGTEQRFDDGSSVIEATEKLEATRTDGLNATLTAVCRRVRKDDIVTVQQDNYSYKDRKLPVATLFLKSDAIPANVPAGFAPTAVTVAIASQFGKNDKNDEGTGSPVMGMVQTNSEIFGASIKVSKMAEHFGQNWRSNPRRLGALIEVHSAKNRRLVRVPLVDVGPGETIPAEVDLTWACDQFLGTKGQAEVSYRLLIPS